jgi:hypothetical protein
MGYGSNKYGQLGIEHIDNIGTPVRIANGVIDVSGGMSHSLFLKKDNSLWGMGANYSYQLGKETGSRISIPVQIAEQAVQIAAGGAHTLFVKKNGTLWAAGSNYLGQLGDSTTTDFTIPKQIENRVAREVLQMTVFAFREMPLYQPPKKDRMKLDTLSSSPAEAEKNEEDTMPDFMKDDALFRKIFLEKIGDVDPDSIDREAALMWAAWNGYTDVAGRLIDNGVNVNTKYGDSNITPLWAASRNGHTDAARMLIEKGARVNAKVSRILINCYLKKAKIMKATRRMKGLIAREKARVGI